MSAPLQTALEDALRYAAELLTVERGLALMSAHPERFHPADVRAMRRRYFRLHRAVFGDNQTRPDRTWTPEELDL